MKLRWHLVWAVFNKESPYLCSIQKTRAKAIRAFVENAKRGKRVRVNKPWSWWYRASGLRCRRMSITMKV